MKTLKFALCLALFAWMSPSVHAQTSGGPDAYGYTWKNSSHTSNPPTYSWVDITTRGDQVTGLADDNVVGPFPLPQGFQYYWYPVSQIWIGSNGYISFNGVNMASPFPSTLRTTCNLCDRYCRYLERRPCRRMCWHVCDRPYR